MSKPPDGVELVDRAKALAPRIAERAAQSEAQRALHDDTIKDLMDSDFLQTLVPKRWGGHELPLSVHSRIVSIISAADVSAGWITAFYMGHNFMVNKWSEKAQAEVFAERPYARVPIVALPGLKAKVVPGGWEVSGRVPYGSGIMHGDWVGLSGIVDETGERLMWLFPAAAVVMKDVWRMAGMAGTGSNDVVVEQRFVPNHRGVFTDQVIEGSTEGSRIHTNPLYQIPLIPFIWNETMCVLSGGLRGATTAFEAIVRKRVQRIGGAVAREQQLVHAQLGEAHTSALVLEALTRDLVSETMACVTAGRWEMRDRIRFKAIAAYIAEHCRLAVQEMMSCSGTSSFHHDQPLQRFFRDLSMVATHEYYNWGIGRETLGRDRLGLEPNHPMV